MNSELVETFFLSFAGLDEATLPKWKPLCDAACVGILSRLREGADAADDRLSLAAAGAAYAQYVLLAGGVDAQSVKIGDISVSGQSGGGSYQNAAALRDELFAGAAALLLPDGGAGLRQVG